MRGRVRWTVFAALALAGLPALARAQARAGGEFRVNSYTTGDQYARVSVTAASTAGRFVVVWESSAGQDGDGYAVMGARFDANGARLGSDFVVNTYTTSHQYFAALGMNASGRFVVSWTSYTQDGSRAGVFAQGFSRDGVRNGGEFQVNAYTTQVQSRSSVGLDAGGNMVIAWRSTTPQEDTGGVFARRYTVSAGQLGAEFQVNAYTTEYQNRPDVARAPDGNFVVVWQSYNQEGASSGYGIYAQRYASDGVPLGPEFRVNAYTTGDQAWPSVAMDGTGNFVVAWTEYEDRDGEGTSVRAQRYSASGAPAGAEFQANSNTDGYQYRPQVGMAADGGSFVVVWTSYANGIGIFGRKFGPTGTPVANDFTVNTYVNGTQYAPSVAVDPVGNFLVTWNSTGQDGSLSGVYGQRFGGLVPAALRVDTTGSPGNDNLVFEPGESVDVRPSWLNVNGATQNVEGAFSSMTGPPGAVYTITDGIGDYDNIANNVVDECNAAECYGVSVNNPPTRPVQHWDATVLETVTSSTSTQGQVKKWALHIGRSFPDVPATNSFYRFIEALLHHGITGGCGGGNYCPTNSTSRAEMSVFVLVAKESAGYAPPACTTPMFDDVPAGSPFCRFIEELARRGVVGGCASNPPRYCPDNAVTREQMAVFVLRTLDPNLTPPACGTPVFADVPASSAFCRWIEELVRRGVVSGCATNPARYCPTNPVTRDQMGVFISLTFGLSLYGP